jgi:hypothetical protein
MEHNMRDILKDIVKHTHSLGIIQAVKVTTEGDETKIDALDDNRSVVLKGRLHNKVDALTGKVGFGRLSVLQGYLNYSGEDTEGKKVDADIVVNKEERNGEASPASISFKMNGGFESNYRLIRSEVVDDQIKTANFKGAKWDVEFMPTQKAVNDLRYFDGVLGGNDSLFTVKKVNGNLIFSIGSNGTDKVDLPFALNVSGELKAAWSYPLRTVNTILRLADTSNMTIKFSDQGAMMIQVDSGLGVYDYILPAKTGN